MFLYDRNGLTVKCFDARCCFGYFQLCLELRNFNAVMAIVVAALGSAPVRRLHKTKEVSDLIPSFYSMACCCASAGMACTLFSVTVAICQVICTVGFIYCYL